MSVADCKAARRKIKLRYGNPRRRDIAELVAEARRKNESIANIKMRRAAK
jgi:hypothetical protein